MRGEGFGNCDGCDRRTDVVRFRGRALCRGCLMADEIPARIEDHMAYESPLALAAELIDETAIGYGSTGDFKKALDRALIKHGIAHTAADAKAALFAGADDGNAAKRARWKAEDQEEAAT